MTNLQKRVASTVAAGAVLLQVALPVFATDPSTSLVITGNGADSDNDVVINQQTTTTVTQDNVAEIENNVKADSNTGGNDANMNTGGGVTIGTGNAKTSVGISNTANSNVLELDSCCKQNVDVEVSGNGYESDNDAVLNLQSATEVFQTNIADIDNEVHADSDTGKNDANMNTGGDVLISTGHATTQVAIANKANSNTAHIGDGSGGASVRLKILGNGAYSDNDIVLNMTRSLSLVQNNLAEIENNVHADADTGKNDANMNTGGGAVILTGNAKTTVGIDNMANFNFADLNCGCLTEVLAKVAGNGYESDNTIVANLLDAKAAFQTNVYACDEAEASLFGGYYGYGDEGCNNVHADSDTGKNDANKNTGDQYDDPGVLTGNATTEVLLENSANANVLVENDSFAFPELPDFDFDFDFGGNWAFWAWLVGMSS